MSEPQPVVVVACSRCGDHVYEGWPGEPVDRTDMDQAWEDHECATPAAPTLIELAPDGTLRIHRYQPRLTDDIQ